MANLKPLHFCLRIFTLFRRIYALLLLRLRNCAFLVSQNRAFALWKCESASGPNGTLYFGWYQIRLDLTLSISDVIFCGLTLYVRTLQHAWIIESHYINITNHKYWKYKFKILVQVFDAWQISPRRDNVGLFDMHTSA